MPSCLSSASIEKAPDGFRFVAVDAPGDAPARGTLIFAAPFAEEMNKSRRMVASMSRALACDGWRVVRADLLGCGDSSGDFGDASWSDWTWDLRRLVDAANPAAGPLWLWGLRAGALLLPPLLAEVPHANLLLWQPATSGAVVLNQFLRLKTVGALTGAASAPDRKSLQAQLDRGESLEIAGYLLSASLAAGLNAARLELPQTHRGRIVWMEVASAEGSATLSPAGASLVEGWRREARSVHAEQVSGPLFWQTVEITEAPELIPRTLLALAQDLAPASNQQARELAA